MSGNDIEDLLSGLKSVIEDAIAKKRKAPKKKVYAARDETEEFVQFWDTWRPHARQNDGRGLARDCFLKHVSNGADPKAIVDGARYFFRTMKERDREYIPLSSTWLNRGAYEDLAVHERNYQKRIADVQRRRSEEAAAPVTSPEKRAEMQERLRLAGLAI